MGSWITSIQFQISSCSVAMLLAFCGSRVRSAVLLICFLLTSLSLRLDMVYVFTLISTNRKVLRDLRRYGTYGTPSARAQACTILFI